MHAGEIITRLRRAARAAWRFTNGELRLIALGQLGDELLDGTGSLPDRPDGRPGMGLRGVALASFQEDLEDLGLAYDATENYNVPEVRARAAHKRADEQLDRMSRARDLLLGLNCVPAQPSPTVERVIGWASDISDDVWRRCPHCHHFLLDHKQSGGCKAPGNPCGCAVAGPWPA